MGNSINTASFCKLSDFALLSISGDDRHEFLHGQLINDLNLIVEPGAQLSAWCNPKGQVISNFLVINTGISYLLLFKQNLKTFVQKRLGMFVLRSRVVIEDITDTSSIIGLANVQDLSILDSTISNYAGTVQAEDGLVTVNIPGSSVRQLVMGNHETIEKKISELGNKLQQTDSTHWELLDVLAGLPWVTTATQEQFLPQMLNLDVLNGMSYQKGCYPGQEVIARLHYKGTVKKRVMLVCSKQTLSIGEHVFLESMDSHVGTIINTALHPDGNCYALAVIETDKLNEELIAEKPPNKVITILDLPYTFPS